MAVNRNAFRGRYAQERFPSLPCPHCSSGTVNLKPDSVTIVEAGYSHDQHSHLAHEPNWNIERFIGFLVCGDPSCREQVAVAGLCDFEREYPPGSEEHWQRVLVPKFMYPSPRMISVPEDVSGEVLELIELIFTTYWVNLGVCSGNIWTVAEIILKDSSGRSESCSVPPVTKYISFKKRIEKYKKIDPENAETFDAIRILGNLGIHEINVSREVVLDGVDLLEDILMKLYSNHSSSIKTIRRRIIDSNAVY
jgi:hypothetical protein